MIKFEKVSYDEYCMSRRSLDANVMLHGCDDTLRAEYESIRLPKRSTANSAGYDFFLPFDVDATQVYITVPTGIRFVTDRDDVFLMCVPRSGLGFKNGFRLANTVGIIDADYCNSDNEGHIMAKFNCVEKSVYLVKGKAFMQGIILPFIKTDDDISISTRNGGFGSTDTPTGSPEQITVFDMLNGSI